MAPENISILGGIMLTFGNILGVCRVRFRYDVFFMLALRPLHSDSQPSTRRDRPQIWAEE